MREPKDRGQPRAWVDVAAVVTIAPQLRQRGEEAKPWLAPYLLPEYLLHVRAPRRQRRVYLSKLCFGECCEMLSDVFMSLAKKNSAATWTPGVGCLLFKRARARTLKKAVGGAVAAALSTKFVP